MPQLANRALPLLRVAIVIAQLVAGSTALAQQTTRIDGDPSCAKCELQAKRHLVLGTLDGDAALFGRPTTVVKDSKGTFYVGEAAGGGSPLVFDSRGRFVRRLAKRGRGPGELLAGIVVLVAPGDSVHVIDLDAGRRSIFSSSGKFVRMTPQPGLGQFGLILPNGTLLYNQVSLHSATAGSPLLLIDSTGKVIRAIGGNYRVAPGDDLWRLARHLGPSRSGRFWAAHHVEYEFSLWSQAGELVRHYERVNDFFRPEEEFRFASSPTTPPRISTIWEDTTGLVWITIQVPASKKDWVAGLGKPEKDLRGQLVYRRPMIGRMFHTLLEVIDPRTGRLLVSRRLPFYVVAATDDGEYAAYRQDDDGVPYVDIWRMRLVQR